MDAARLQIRCFIVAIGSVFLGLWVALAFAILIGSPLWVLAIIPVGAATVAFGSMARSDW